MMAGTDDAATRREDPTGRASRLQRLTSGRWDLVVVGGGITGAAVLHEATRRGLRAALAERDDFASGTSSGSSKMLHGGLRYLAYGKVRLVRTAVHERDRLLAELGPAAVPTRLVVPLPNALGGRLLLRGGTWLYSAFSSGPPLGVRRRLSNEELARAVPGLDVRAFHGAVEVGEAVVDDAGLVLRRLRSAEVAGAVAVNRLSATSVAAIGAGRVELRVSDGPTGRATRVVASRAVNAAGIWATSWGGSAGIPSLRFSRGVHLVFARSAWPIASGVVLPAVDHRWVFVLPYGAFVLVGTTDVEEPGVPSDVHVHAEDVRYLWNVLRNAFPNLGLGPNDVVDAYAGVRALWGDPAKPVTAVARDEMIARGPGPMWTIVGGKLTTHRAMARRLLDAMGVPDRPSETRRPSDRAPSRPRGGGTPVPGAELLYRWAPDDAPASKAIAEYVSDAVRTTQPVSLGDLIDRRFHALHRLSPRFAEVASRVADEAAAALGWSDEDRRHELDAVRADTARSTRGVRAE